jgi:hypothetical protein
LFDEVEKAHPDILNILLQILEDGRLTDSQKRLVQFDNTVIIMTSNAAADEIQQIIKAEREKKKEDLPEVIEGEVIEKSSGTSPDLNSSAIPLLSNSELASETTGLTLRTYKDDYAGAIQFLESPITENFLGDIKKQLRVEFESSFRALSDADFIDNELQKNKPFKQGKKKEKEENNILKAAVLERLSTLFLPEFLNRLDDIIIFQPLRPEELRKICDIMIKEVRDRIKVKQISLVVEDSVKVKLSREGYNPAFGARPLRRLITKYIEDLISENLLTQPMTKKERQVKIILNEEDQIIIETP